MTDEPGLDTPCHECRHPWGRHWVTNDRRPGKADQGCTAAIDNGPNVTGVCKCTAFTVAWVPALAVVAPLAQPPHDPTAPRHLTYGQQPLHYDASGHPYIPESYERRDVGVVPGQPGGGQIEQQPGLQADVTWEPIS